MTSDQILAYVLLSYLIFLILFVVTVGIHEFIEERKGAIYMSWRKVRTELDLGRGTLICLNSKATFWLNERIEPEKVEHEPWNLHKYINSARSNHVLYYTIRPVFGRSEAALRAKYPLACIYITYYMSGCSAARGNVPAQAIVKPPEEPEA